MSRPSSRLLANTTSRIPSSLSLHQTFLATTTSRSFSQTCARKADSLLGRIGQASQQQEGQGQEQTQQQEPRYPPTGPPRPPPIGPPRPINPSTWTPSSSSSSSWTSSPRSSEMSDLQRVLASDTMYRAQNRTPSGAWGADSLVSPSSSSSSSYSLDLVGASADGALSKQFEDLGPPTEPFHFHVYSHKHNCHITVTKPNRGAILSLSAGNIGFRKSKRGSYDAAYQLTAYAMDKLNQGGWHKVIQTMEVVLRGFGSGREAATKVLLGAEGKMLRHTITKVSDATRLKFGGTRSPRPRRLG